MPSLVDGSSPLPEVTVARKIHQEGCSYFQEGRYDEAEIAYDAALHILKESEPTIDVQLWSARILKDNGLNYAHQVSEDFSMEPMTAGLLSIHRSLAITAPYLWDQPSRQSVANRLIELMHVHGSTTSMDCRLRAVEQVAFGVYVSDDYVSAQHDYANFLLSRGEGESDYDVCEIIENCLVAARFALIQDDQRDLERWQKEAERNVKWAKHHDLRNLSKVLRLVHSRSRDLTSLDAAISSVVINP